MRLTHSIAPAVLAGAMVVAGTSGTFTADAAKVRARPHLVLVAGQVSNLSTTGFTVTWTPKKTTATPKTWQIALATTTKQVAAKGTTGALQNGEYAIVVGAKSTTGIAARNVRYSTTAFRARLVRILRARLRLRQLTAPRARAVHGTVNLASTSATQLAITTKAGKALTFAITSTTRYRVNKVLQTTAPTFTAGEAVTVVFKRDKTTKSLVALGIGIKTT